MSKPDPDQFARVVLWHLAGLRTDVQSLETRLAELQGLQPPIPSEETRTTLKDQAREKLYLEALAEVSFAEQKATELANGEAWRAHLTQADWASYQRCRELLCHLPSAICHGGPPSLELAVSIYTDSVQKLPPGVSLQEAVRFYLEHQP